ncbi:hypothetical protein [Citrobacter sp. Cpo150]|uniref:hypothetical protein n=1 Tax=Citrobacter sp. Cpo150 TaxID=2985154 RepID=UPI0025789658|nr:hypothetical protein [Citrobacter sp. Cpo150]MDM2764403.1 DUF551 domain-containing protein [Citrobacter sp. Cpo150]
MTTNNHPAHGPVSLERLHKMREILSKAAAQSDGGNLGYAMADAVKVIDGVIATFGAEPVAIFPVMYKGIELLKKDGLELIRDGIAEATELESMCMAKALLSAQSALVVPDEIDLQTCHLDGVTETYAEGWNACRAAMLQDAEPVTTASKLPFEQWLSQQTGTIDVECGCVMTEVFFHWLRVAYEAGNSPATPDAWIPVSERMLGRSGVYMVWNGKHIGAVSLFFGSFQCIKPEQITHWRHMPAAPQEEKTERKK